MQGKAWTGLLQKVPPEQHDLLVLMTTNGTEIVIQRLVRLENDFLVALGRLAGSTEQGKVLVIPYDQLTYLAINKQLTDAQIDATLGTQGGEAIAESQATNNQPLAARPAAVNSAAVRVSGPAKTGGQPEGDKGEKAGQVADTASADKAPVKHDPKASPPSKTMLLARLRQRLAEGAAKQPLRD